MSNENQSLPDDTGDNQKTNPCRRRRSSSLGSKRNFQGNNVLRNSNRSEQLQKYASSGQLFNNSDIMVDNDSAVPSPRSQNKFSMTDIFTKWFNDPKSVRIELTRLHENNIFKTGFHIQEKYNSNDYYPPVMYLFSHNLKIDNDYEIYTINNYDVSIGEFLSTRSEDSEIYKEYRNGFSVITQKKEDEEANSNRRHSEIIGLGIANKNQTMSYFLPNKLFNGYEVVIKYGDVFVIDQARKSDKSLRHIILTNYSLSIFATKKAERLKYRFFLKHLYCEICTDHQIQNIDSSLRIGGPFGDDLILTLSSPNSRNEWLTAIQNYMAILLDTFKAHSTEITVYKNLETNSSAPLMSKTFSVTGFTKGLELKKKAIEGFNPMEKNTSDFILTFTVSSTTNRENILNDDVFVMILQEHLGCFADSTGCNEKCVGNINPPSRTHFYLKYNPSRDKTKKPKLPQDLKPNKAIRCVLNEQWPDNVFPDWIMILLSDIYHQGSETEGIFRIPGSVTRCGALMQSINNNGENVKIKEEIHTKANVLKKFMGSIDGSIFTHANKETLTSLLNEVVSLEEFSKNPDQIRKLLSMTENLPQNNYHLLQLFLVVLHHISENEVVSKMSLSNLAVCLAPTILTDMLDLSPNDYHKLNIVFECLLSLFNKIVDEPTHRRLVATLKERRLSTDSTYASAEDNSTTATIVSISGPEVADETDGVVKRQPSVPPRRKRQDIDNLFNKEFQPLNSHSGAQKLVIKKSMLHAMHASASDEKPSDTVDCGAERYASNQDVTATARVDNVKIRYQPKKRNSRDRHTVAITADNISSNKVPVGAVVPSPLRRQGQVIRKHRDNSMTNYKTNFDEQRTIDNAEPSPVVRPQNDGQSHLIRDNNRGVYAYQMRSRGRTPHENVNEKSKANNEHYVLDQKRASLDSASLEHRRSSSTSSRVPSMVQDYEKKNSKKKDNNNNISPALLATTPGMGPDAKLLKKTVNRSPRTGPVQPSHDIGANTERSSRKHATAGIQRSSTMEMSLKETIEASDDNNVVII